MSRLSPIVAGTDFSSGGKRSLERAARLSKELGWPVIAVHVVESPTTAPAGVPSFYTLPTGRREVRMDSPGLRLAASSARTRITAAVKDLGGEVRSLVRVGSASRALLSTARAHSARLIVVGVHKASRSVETFFLGTTAERILRSGRFPVLLARTPATAGYHKVLVPVDLGEVALEQVRLAATVAPGARLVLVHVLGRPGGEKPWERQGLRHAVEALDALGRKAGVEASRVRSVAEVGEPRAAILELARRHDADLVVLGTQARRGPERWVLGSVAEYVLRAAGVDVLAVPPPGAAKSGGGRRRRAST